MTWQLGEPALRWRDLLPAENVTKFLLIYENGDLSKAPANFAAHRELWRVYSERGTLLMVGPVMGAPALGALGVFTTREAAEEFAKSDPFVVNGVASRWSIAEWKEALR
jgi:uncharacterized protein YciI